MKDLFVFTDDSEKWSLEHISFRDKLNDKLPNMHYRSPGVIWIGTATEYLIFTTINECEQAYERNTPITRTPPLQSRRDKHSNTIFMQSDFDFEFPIYICHEHKKGTLRGPVNLYDFVSSLNGRI
jgi:hypothetical protein